MRKKRCEITNKNGFFTPRKTRTQLEEVKTKTSILLKKLRPTLSQKLKDDGANTNLTCRRTAK